MTWHVAIKRFKRRALPNNKLVEMLNFFDHASHFVFLQRLAPGALHRAVLAHGFALIVFAFLNALLARTFHCRDLFPIQQRIRLDRIASITGSDDNGVRQTRHGVHADMVVQPEVPVISLVRLVHFKVAFLVLVSGRWRRCNQGRVDDCAFA